MFSGSIVALITPFHKGKIDVAALEALVQWHATQGTHAIVVCGSTGEAALLTPEERHCIIERAVAVSRIPIIVGCGAPSTHDTLRMMEEAHAAGAHAALVVTPYFVKPTQEGLYQHFRTLSTACPLPIIVYSNPGRAGVEISVDLLAHLSELPTVVGIKDSCSDLTRVIKMRQRVQKPFAFLSGDDPLAPAYLAHGGDGVISVTANIAPRLNADLVESWQQGNRTKFAELRDQLLELHEMMFCETSPSPVKYAVSLLGRCQNEVRLPLLPIQPENAQALSQLMKQLELCSSEQERHCG